MIPTVQEIKTAVISSLLSEICSSLHVCSPVVDLAVVSAVRLPGIAGTFEKQEQILFRHYLKGLQLGFPFGHILMLP